MRAKELLSVIKAVLIQAVSFNINKTTLTIVLTSFIVLGGTEKYLGAEMVSRDSPFGPNTITYDTETGLEWLDVTVSTPYSYDEILIEIEPGGAFDGYRLATTDEILTFWQNAGINVGAGFLNSWTTENFQPIVNLMAWVGITGPGVGDLGGGNFFDYTVGHIESGPGGGLVSLASIGADPDPTETGVPSFGSVPSDSSQNTHGSWLITKKFLAMPWIPLLLFDN
ncbi:MAG: hypothetical protein WBM69_23495 [Desulfobacterales bacterium]